MTKLKNWIGLCALLLSLQVYGSEINIQDAWIRTLTTGQENAMVGMVISSARQARIISVISPAYMVVAIQGPSKSGANKMQELEFIDLPAQKSVVLSAESVHLLLSVSRKTLGAADKVPLIMTVQFDDQTKKIITIMAQPTHSMTGAAIPLGSNAATQASTDMPPTAPRTPVETSSKVDAKTVTPAPSKAMANPVDVASPAKPVVASRPPVAEVKPLKAAPVAVVKPAPAPVAARVVAAPLPAPVAPPVAVVVPGVAPLTVEPKKAPEAKPAEPPKQEEARASAECLSLAEELGKCDHSNDRMLEWCETSAKAKYSCQLTMEQLKKLRNKQSR